MIQHAGLTDVIGWSLFRVGKRYTAASVRAYTQPPAMAGIGAGGARCRGADIGKRERRTRQVRLSSAIAPDCSESA